MDSVWLLYDYQHPDSFLTTVLLRFLVFYSVFITQTSNICNNMQTELLALYQILPFSLLFWDMRRSCTCLPTDENRFPHLWILKICANQRHASYTLMIKGLKAKSSVIMIFPSNIHALFGNLVWNLFIKECTTFYMNYFHTESKTHPNL